VCVCVFRFRKTETGVRTKRFFRSIVFITKSQLSDDIVSIKSYYKYYTELISQYPENRTKSKYKKKNMY